MSDLASSNDAATNGVGSRIGSKPGANVNAVLQWKQPLKESGCLEIPEICKRRFSGMSCLYVCRSDPDFVV